MIKNKKYSELESILKKSGYRTTQPRRVILEALLGSKGHLMAKEIYLKINKKYPDIGFTTIYRTLDLLVKMKVINKFEFGDGQGRYELAWEFKEHHHHLICSNCGKIIDYNDFIDDEVKFFNKIQIFLSKKYKFSINSHEVYFYGKCHLCK